MHLSDERKAELIIELLINEILRLRAHIRYLEAKLEEAETRTKCGMDKADMKG